MRTLFLACRQLSSCYVLTWQRGLASPNYKGPNPITGAHPQDLIYTSKYTSKYRHIGKGHLSHTCFRDEEDPECHIAHVLWPFRDLMLRGSTVRPCGISIVSFAIFFCVSLPATASLLCRLRFIKPFYSGILVFLLVSHKGEPRACLQSSPISSPFFPFCITQSPGTG